MSARIPWTSNGFYLPERPSFTLDPLFHAGVYYVQEASGMFVEHALRNTVDLSSPLKVLDLCAAPGGKSTLIQSLISKESLLLSNEVIKTRVPVLHQNMSKWGLMNGMISNNDPKDFRRIPGYFDVLMIDAPCSGSGLFRKDPAAIREWTEEGVRLCSQRQQRILADAWDCLKENGVLIYSTCSYSTEENEDILDCLLNQFACESLRLPLDASWNIIETRSEKANGYGYRFYPDKINGEGFFLAVVQKKSEVNGIQKVKEKREMPNKQEETAVRKFIPDEDNQFIRMSEWIHVMPAGLLADFLTLKNYLYMKKAGVMAGRMGSGEWIPDHELALSTGLNPEIPELELSGSDALKYLRREVLRADVQKKGWIPVSFRHQKLGWVKILPNRLNNYFPKSWRILK
ncbi:MAG: RNA methyltransferase [Bacteroidota bacterium]|nr:RNA methyltransferase [Bacteroidota bacterium]